MQKSIIRAAILTVLVLLISLLGNTFVDGWNWTVSDFVGAGSFIFVTGLAYQLISKKGGSTAYRVATGISILAGFLIVWINLAVGIIGSEDNPANLLFFWVLLIGIVGAVISRLGARGLSNTTIVMAVAQFLVPVAAVVVWPEAPIGNGVVHLFAINTFFVLMWVGAAVLFRRAARMLG